MNVVFWDWDHQRPHPVPIFMVIEELLKSTVNDPDKIGGVNGVPVKLSFEELHDAFDTGFDMSKGWEDYYELENGYLLEYYYMPEHNRGYISLARQWGKHVRRVSRSFMFTLEVLGE